jgi:hypothetical protein
MCCRRLLCLCTDEPCPQVKVPGCSITITPLPYTNGAASSIWYQLANPTANVNFDPRLAQYTTSPGGSYGREHIYELQLRAWPYFFDHGAAADSSSLAVARFIGSLSSNTQLAPLWAGTTFCAWATATLLPAVRHHFPANTYFSHSPADQDASAPVSSQRCHGGTAVHAVARQCR